MRLSHLDTYLSSRMHIKDTKYGEFSSQRLAGPGGCSKKYIMIRVVYCMKYLCLDWIEVSKPKTNGNNVNRPKQTQ